MSAPAEAWFREIYRTEVIMKYKNRGFRMKPTVMPPARVDGKKLYFPVSLGNASTATKTKRGDLLKPMNSGRELKEITTEWYEAAEEIFTKDINKMAPNEQDVALADAAKALGKAHDSVIYSKIHAGAGTYGTVVGAFANAWTIESAMTVSDLLMQKTDLDDDEFYCLLPIRAWSQMMTYAAFNRSEYVGDTPLVKNQQARTWMGVNWIKGYNSLFPLSGTDQTFYAWSRRAVGSGDMSSLPETEQRLGDGIATNIFYDGRKRCYVVDNTIDVGATVLLTEGVVECKMKSDSGIALPTVGA